MIFIAPFVQNLSVYAMPYDKENLCVHEVNTFQQVNALYDFNLLVDTFFSTRELKIIISRYWELLTHFLECKMKSLENIFFLVLPRYVFK